MQGLAVTPAVWFAMACWGAAVDRRCVVTALAWSNTVLHRKCWLWGPEVKVWALCIFQQLLLAFPVLTAAVWLAPNNASAKRPTHNGLVWTPYRAAQKEEVTFPHIRHILLLSLCSLTSTGLMSLFACICLRDSYITPTGDTMPCTEGRNQNGIMTCKEGFTPQYICVRIMLAELGACLL